MKLVALAVLAVSALCSSQANQNVVIGTNNVVKGANNLIRGQNNQIFGYSNSLQGFDNVAIISGSEVCGDDNWLVGNGLTYEGSGLRMFGPNTSPEIRARWRKLSC